MASTVMTGTTSFTNRPAPGEETQTKLNALSNQFDKFFGDLEEETAATRCERARARFALSPPLPTACSRALVFAARARVARAGRPLTLTARELALLELLMSAPGRLFSRERILATVWGTHEDPLTNIVDVYIRRLRSKVDEGFEPALIHTQRGLGYRLEEPGR